MGEGEGGMIWENGIETCILSCKKRITSLGSIQDTGCLGLVHWDDPERWYGEGGGKGVQDWELMYTVADSCQCMVKPIQYCKVKKNKIKSKKKKRVLLIFLNSLCFPVLLRYFQGTNNAIFWSLMLYKHLLFYTTVNGENSDALEAQISLPLQPSPSASFIST